MFWKASETGLNGFSITPCEAGAKEAAREISDFILQWEDAAGLIRFKTSGSTGPPKEIFFSADPLRQAAEASLAAFKLTEKQGGFVCALPPATVAARMLALRARLLQRPVWVLKPALKISLNALPEGPIAQISLSPAQMFQLVRSDNMKAIRAAGSVLLGGSPLPQPLEDYLKNSGLPVHITYGMTETLSHVALRSPGDSLYKALHPDIAFDVDSRGCLLIHTPWNPVPVITTDQVALVDTKSFYWLGRTDFVINSGGVKIHPEEVETLLSRIIPPEMSYFVAPMPDSLFGAVPVLCVEGPPRPIPWEQNIKEVVPHKLWIPKKILFLPQFSRTSEGKFLRAATLATLAQLFQDDI